MLVKYVGSRSELNHVEVPIFRLKEKDKEGKEVTLKVPKRIGMFRCPVMKQGISVDLPDHVAMKLNEREDFELEGKKPTKGKEK